MKWRELISVIDIARIVRDYEAWKAQQAFQDDDGENYARYLKTQQELRILAALRKYAIPGSGNLNRTDNVYAILNGEEEILRAVEGGDFGEA